MHECVVFPPLSCQRTSSMKWTCGIVFVQNYHGKSTEAHTLLQLLIQVLPELICVSSRKEHCLLDEELLCSPESLAVAEALHLSKKKVAFLRNISDGEAEWNWICTRIGVSNITVISTTYHKFTVLRSCLSEVRANRIRRLVKVILMQRLDTKVLQLQRSWFKIEETRIKIFLPNLSQSG